MKSQGNINQMMQNTQRYWYQDGISDLGMGGWLLLIGVFFAAESLTPPGSPLWAVWGLGMPLALIGGGLAVSWAVKRAKSRLTFPRTGFVEYERKGLAGIVRLVGAGLAGAAVATGMVLIYWQIKSLSLIFGVAFLGAFGFLGYRVRVWRYVFLGLWCFVLGIATSAVSLSLEQSSAIFYIGAGVGMIVLGAIVWRRYNHNAPMPQETDDGANR